MIKEFRDFILRGNVVDLAVGIVIGTAFGAVVAAFVADLLTPLVTIPGTVNFAGLSATVGGAEFRYGHFLNALVYFVIIAAALFFVVVKPVNALMARRKTEPEVTAPTKTCPECLSSIPAEARRCAFCASLQGVVEQ